MPNDSSRLRSPSADELDQKPPRMGPNSVPTPPAIGPRMMSDRAGNIEHLLGKQVVVIEREHHAGKRCHGGGDDHRDHFVVKRVDAGRARGLFILADRQPEIADPAFQQRRDRRMPVQLQPAARSRTSPDGRAAARDRYGRIARLAETGRRSHSSIPNGRTRPARIRQTRW